MGFFGTYRFNGASWTDVDTSGHDDTEPFLLVDIHDSDFTTVTYGPAGPGSGTAYLGCTPRIYFDDEDASPPTDVELEASGLVEWWMSLLRDATGSDPHSKRLEIASFLAADQEPPDEEPTDDADVFVEIKTARFLTVLGLPLPPDLAGI